MLKIILIVALLLVLVGIFTAGSSARVERAVYGRPLSEQELDLYMTKWLPRYQPREGVDYKVLFVPGQFDQPSIMQTRRGTWYLNDYGTIPYDSKWNVMIEAKFKDWKPTLEKRLPL